MICSPCAPRGYVEIALVGVGVGMLSSALSWSLSDREQWEEHVSQTSDSLHYLYYLHEG